MPYKQRKITKIVDYNIFITVLLIIVFSYYCSILYLGLLFLLL